MSRRISVTLRCDGCERVHEWRPWFSLTKMGVLRLEGTSGGFYVDGGATLCDHCAGDKYDLPPQRETWSEYERRNVERDQDHERTLERIAAAYPGLEVRRP